MHQDIAVQSKEKPDNGKEERHKVLSYARAEFKVHGGMKRSFVEGALKFILLADKKEGIEVFMMFSGNRLGKMQNDLCLEGSQY